MVKMLSRLDDEKRLRGDFGDDGGEGRLRVDEGEKKREVESEINSAPTGSRGFWGKGKKLLRVFPGFTGAKRTAMAQYRGI
jgi:hypothetical protein